VSPKEGAILSRTRRASRHRHAQPAAPAFAVTPLPPRQHATRAGGATGRPSPHLARCERAQRATETHGTALRRPDLYPALEQIVRDHDSRMACRRPHGVSSRSRISSSNSCSASKITDANGASVPFPGPLRTRAEWAAQETALRHHPLSDRTSDRCRQRGPDALVDGAPLFNPPGWYWKTH
jgi:hypothetical protein